MEYLTFALAKGRLAKKSLELFEKIGIHMEEMKDPGTRKLIFVNEEQKIKMFLAKAQRCAYLCGIRRSRHWRCGQGYDPGKKTAVFTRLWILASASAACAYAARQALKSGSCTRS